MFDMRYLVVLPPASLISGGHYREVDYPSECLAALPVVWEPDSIDCDDEEIDFHYYSSWRNNKGFGKDI